MDSVIQASDLTLTYNYTEDIIKQSNIDIKAGQFVFITGPSGSGKSTLIKAMFGLLKPKNGSLFVGGYDMSKVNTAQLNTLRKHIGMVFQDYKLINEWSIEKNVMLPLIIAGYAKDVCEVQVQKLLSHVKLSHQLGKLPLELSGGEQQRVAMARALSNNPTMILADEPTGNLDDYSSKLIWDLLVGAQSQLNTTVIIVTHRIPEALGVDYKHYHIEYGTIYEVT